MLTETLKRVPFFQQLNTDQLENLIRLGKVIHCEAQTPIFVEGDEATSMYIVNAGTVRVFKNTDEGELELNVLRQGDFVGEMALLDSQQRSATAMCLTPCELFEIDQFAFTTLILKSRSQVVFRVFSALTQRIRETNEKYFKEELARRTLASQLEIERLRALTQMVAGVAHEINTPLGIINTASSVVASTLGEEVFKNLATQDRQAKMHLEDVQEALELMRRNVHRAHRLTQDFKKISVSQISDEKERFDLLMAIEETLSLFSINARRAHLEIKMLSQLSPEDREWCGYRGYLSQILMNLLTNVERYAYPAGQGGKIEITLARNGDKFVLGIRDFGVGIPPENLPKIFEPFFTTGRISGGTGLGMTIVHNIVASALKGKISVESIPQVGTTFTLLLPVEVPDF